MPGVFITFEGLDGCGKSTQLRKLAAALRREGHHVISTREPGGTPLGERIRELLLNSRTRGLAPGAELALMCAARAQHVEQIILPNLRAGRIVLCDRFADSTEAYQGAGRGLGTRATAALRTLFTAGAEPDLTLLMDCELEATLARARRRNRRKAADESRFEAEDRRFFERVRAAYLAIAAREPGRVTVVDARRDPETVHREILQRVRARLRRASTGAAAEVVP